MQIEGKEIYRTDRTHRRGGGVITYLRDDFAMKSKLKPSNSFCDTLGIHIPEIKLALVTIYRPPKCPQFRMKECLETVRDWASSLETEGQPTATILISTDINLGFLENMNEENLRLQKRQLKREPISEKQWLVTKSKQGC